MSKYTSKEWKKRYAKDNRLNRHLSWVNFLSENGYNACSICNYSKCFRALDFHHIDPKTKEFNISSFKSCKVFNDANGEILLKEVRKCVLLCANCHRELHDTIYMNSHTPY